jgi:hypothetical protein
MPEPCIQTAAMQRIEGKLDDLGESLQILAVQKVEIDHIKTDQESLRRWVRTHEDQIQVLKLQPGLLAGKIIYMMAGVGTTVTAGLIIFAVTR